MGERKFRVGDRVRLVEDYVCDPWVRGKEFTIQRVSPSGTVEGPNDVPGSTERVFVSRLDLLELVERTKFEPGDEVLVLRSGVFGVVECAVGKQATVVRVGVNDDGPWVDINVPESELMDGAAGSLRQTAQPSDLWPVEHPQPLIPLTARYEAPTPTYSVEAELREALAREQEAHLVTCCALERFKQSNAEQSLELLRESRRANEAEAARDEAVARLRALHDAYTRLDRERDATEEFLDRLDGADIPF